MEYRCENGEGGDLSVGLRTGLQEQSAHLPFERCR